MLGVLYLIVAGWMVWHRANRHGLKGWLWLLMFLIGTVILWIVVPYSPESSGVSGLMNILFLLLLYWYIPRRGRRRAPEAFPRKESAGS